MESILTDVAKPNLERLMDKAIAESRYVCCFTSIAEDFEKEREDLDAERETVRQRVELATRSGEDIRSDVRLWEEKANKLIQEDTKTKKTCIFGLCPNLKWRYNRGKELANKTEETKKLREKGKELDNVGLPARLPDVERYSSQDYISFKSRELKYKELMDALKDESNYMTGLQGMGGTGKTTLAKKVGKELKQSEQFTQVIDATVSFTPDIKKIQDDIAGPLGLKWDNCSESDRPKKLWSRLTNGEKILLILDDVWGASPINFEEIGIPKRDNHKCCRVLVTTRDLSVCKSMGCKIIELELLSEEDAWIMFQRHADISDSSPRRLLDKGREITNECKGLPIAIAVVASSLKGQERQEEWDVALKSLQKPVPMHVDDEKLAEIYKCLKFSYDNMKDEKAKGLFLLCSVFREDEVIPTETLTRLSIGAGLVGEDYERYDDARSQVLVAKNKLLNSCLLLKEEKGDVKMHDLVREVAQQIVNKEIRAVNLSNKNQKSLVERAKNIKYLLLEGKLMDVSSCTFDGSKLEILIVLFMYEEQGYYCVEHLNAFFEYTAGLRVLHLYSSWAYQLLSLPQSKIQSLTNIRSLLVHRVDLGDISILGSLRSLETLDLVGCRFNELPSEITTLEKFRLLKLEGCIIQRNNPFEVIGRCSSLEELYFVHCYIKDVDQGRITIPTLQRYCLIERDHVHMDDSISKFADLSGAFFSEGTLEHLMRTAEVLYLNKIEVEWRNLIPEIVPIIHGMNDLVQLHLKRISQLRCLIDTKHIYSQVQNVFSKLVKLKLKGMENLEELCTGPLPFDALKSLEDMRINCCNNLRSLFKCKLNLCNLKTIRLSECPKLVSLFQMSTSRSLVLLEELIIYDCEQLEIIITDEREREKSGGEIVGDNDNMSRGSMFPNLKVLDIWGCPRLEFILPILSARDLPIIEIIKLEFCDELKHIFGQNVELSSLKEIELNALPKFIDIFPECYHPMPSFVTGSSSRDGSKAQIQLEPIQCNIFSWTHICCYGHEYRHKLRSTTSTKIPLVSEDQLQDCSIASVSNLYCLPIWEHAQCLSRQSHILCNIKHFELTHLSKIKSVFILSIAPRMLLETLKIESCDELKHIIIDIGDDKGGNNWGNVFPKLKELYVQDCGQLEYIFGHYARDHQNHNEIHLHLPALKCLNLHNLPSLTGMCPKNFRTTLPPLTELGLIKCSKVDIKSIGDFIAHLISRSLDSTTIKDLSGNMEHFLALENLKVHNSKVENIFCLNEINGQQMNLGLQKIQLYDMPQMTYPFKGPKNSYALQNLISLTIKRCEKMKIIFSASILRYLPQLLILVIEECNELKHIIEDDVESQRQKVSNSPRTCFPELQVFAIVKCNKLKSVFPVSICKELPKLKVLMIKEANELEEIYGCEGDQQVEIPNLKYVAFVKLPSLCQAKGIQFQAIENRFVQNCQKLSLTSSLPHIINLGILYSLIDYELCKHLGSLYRQSLEDSKTQETSDENPIAKTTEDFPVGLKVQAATGHELTSSQELQNEQSKGQQYLVNQQHPLGETNTSFKISQGNNCLKEKEDQSIQEGSTSEKNVTTILSTNSETRNESPIPLVAPIQKGIKRVVEEGTTSANGKTITSSTHLESDSSSSGPLVTSDRKTYSQEDGNGQIAIPSFAIATSEPFTTKEVDVDGDSHEITESNDLVSLNDATPMKVSLIIEEQFSKDVEIRVLESKPSPRIPSPVASRSPSMSYEGDPSQIVEDLSFSCLVTWELEQLVSKKHLASENLSLLIDFLVKHPFVNLTDNSLSDRYKGYAYNCLAEMLKFLQTHSVLDVLRSNQSEFVELLQDVRRCAFDKDWLDGVERRALFPDFQVSQDALQKLLDSKQLVTKEVEGLRLKIGILTQHVEDLKHQLTSSEAVLESIIQQEAQILEARAALRAPLGY